MKRRGIFFKVFTYTTIFIILLVFVTIALFSQQFISFYNTAQTRQLYGSYQGLFEQLHGKSIDEVLDIAQKYYENNQSFSFYIKDNGNKIVFTTPNIDPDVTPDRNNFRIIMSVGQDYVIGAGALGMETDYGSLIFKSLLALACMLALGVTGAFIFARQITKPIKRLAANTKKMANLEDMPSEPERRDELGDLSNDVHAMYDKLKNEIIRKSEMEETQRYFFSAASHELKTPIAAAGVLLEGMIANIGDYKDHPKYLRECIRLMDAQNKVISEILEIVNLTDGKIEPNLEKLNIACTVAELLPSFYPLADANGQRIAVDIPENQICLADSKMLKKALSNVILNAVQNTPNDGEIRIWTEPVADQYRLCVLNTGVQIDDDILTKLFDPFYRADKARSRKNGNNGLGLTIVQKALEIMNFDYSLENAPDGVLFRLDLPEI